MTLYQTASLVGILGTAALCLVHFALTRPWRTAPPREPRDVPRYSRWERLVHAAVAVGFVALAVTAYWAALRGERMESWLLMAHTAGSSLFFAGVLAMGLTWAWHCRFGRADGAWLRRPRLGPGGPAGRFDALGKAYFWLAGIATLVLTLTMMLSMVDLLGSAGQLWMYEAHRWTALVLLATTILHIYRSVLAKPGGLVAIARGRVSRAWARRYHPAWLDEADEPPAPDG